MKDTETSKFTHKLSCSGCQEPIAFDYKLPNHLVLWDVNCKKEYRFHNLKCLKGWIERDEKLSKIVDDVYFNKDTGVKGK